MLQLLVSRLSIRTAALLLAGLAWTCWQMPALAQDAAHPEAKSAETKPAEAHADEHAPKAADAHNDPAHPAGDGHAAAGHSDAGHGEAGHDPGGPITWKEDLALWTLITFGLTLIVLRATAWGPLTSALDTREAGIRHDIEQAEANRIKAEQLLVNYQKQLATAQEEVTKILAEARRDAEHTRQEILGNAEKEVSAMKDRAITEINTVKSQALDELFGHISGTVAQATERVLGRALTPGDQDRLINEALAEFSSRKH